MNKGIKSVASVAVVLAGRVDNQEAAATAPKTHKDYPEIEILSDSFKINVKDDDDKVVYSNDSEPFEYEKVPSLVSALRLNGAKLTDDQITFINEALTGEETGKAVSSLLEVVNSDLRESAKSRRYAAVFNQHKPVTEERIESAHASMVRNFIVTNKGQVSDETAVNTLKQFKLIPEDYTVEMFRANKGKR